MSNKTYSEQYKKDFDDYVKRLHDGKLNSKITPEQVKILKEKMLQSLELDVQQLVSAEKFISGLVLRMPIIPTRDCRIDTAMTNGTNIYFDIDFYTQLTQDERIFVIAHEVWHNALLHFLRRENRQDTLWNIATDCEINYALCQDDMVIPPGLCYPSKSDEGKCAEDIYDNLLKRMKKRQKQQAKNGQGQKQQSQGGQTGGRGNGQGSGMDDFDMDSDSENGYSKTKNDPRNKNGSGKFSREQFDNHMDKSREGEDYSETNTDCFRAPTDKWGEKGFDPDFNPIIDDAAADKIREMVISEAQRYERTKGTVPSSLERVLNSICKPEVKWEELLSQFVTSCMGDRRQWLPPLRRGVYNEMYFQSRRGEKISVSCIVDTSGSTEADIPKFLSELVSLLETYGRYELALIHCDCAVHKVDIFDEANPFPVENPLDYHFFGGGGSSLIPAYEKLKELEFEPSCNIVFTDGYIDCPEKNPLDIPTMFVLTSDGAKNLCNWGTKIQFKDKRADVD